MPNHWLVKTEPSCYSFAQLVQERQTRWEGVRNALAIKHLGLMAVGDAVLVYHTGDEKSVIGLAKVTKGAYPDPDLADPKRLVVDLTVVKTLPRPVPLDAIKAEPIFHDSPLVRIGRLSVVPITPLQWKRLLSLGGV